MDTGYFSIVGDRTTIDELRSALLEEPNAKQLLVTEALQQGPLSSPPSDRVRQIELADALFAFAIHVPAGLAAHTLYDWSKNWLKSRAGDTRVIEHPPSSSDTTTSPESTPR